MIRPSILEAAEWECKRLENHDLILYRQHHISIWYSV